MSIILKRVLQNSNIGRNLYNSLIKKDFSIINLNDIQDEDVHYLTLDEFLFKFKDKHIEKYVMIYQQGNSLRLRKDKIDNIKTIFKNSKAKAAIILHVKKLHKIYSDSNKLSKRIENKKHKAFISLKDRLSKSSMFNLISKGPYSFITNYYYNNTYYRFKNKDLEKNDLATLRNIVDFHLRIIKNISPIPNLEIYNIIKDINNIFLEKVKSIPDSKLIDYFEHINHKNISKNLNLNLIYQIFAYYASLDKNENDLHTQQTILKDKMVLYKSVEEYKKLLVEF